MNNESILVVDDDPAVLRLVAEVLTQSGYLVYPASGPEQALGLFKRYTEELGLVVTDVVMPGMSGPDLVDCLHAVRPNLPVLYMSGYANVEMVRDRIAARGASLLTKPFLMSTLLSKARALLDEGPLAATG
jgi:DNA-binding NtrC family response regulator